MPFLLKNEIKCNPLFGNHWKRRYTIIEATALNRELLILHIKLVYVTKRLC